MNEKKDYYKILGVNFGAGADEIKRGYREKALLHHPDKWEQGSAEEKSANEDKFKEAGEAYEVLTTPAKRAIYDKIWKDKFEPKMSREEALSKYPHEQVRRVDHMNLTRRMVEQQNMYKKLQEEYAKLAKQASEHCGKYGKTAQAEKIYREKIATMKVIKERISDNLTQITKTAAEYGIKDIASQIESIKESMDEFAEGMKEEIVIEIADLTKVEMINWGTFEQLFTKEEKGKIKNYDSFYKDVLKRKSPAWVAAPGDYDDRAALLYSDGLVNPFGRNVDGKAVFALALKPNLPSGIFKSLVPGVNPEKVRVGDYVRLPGFEEYWDGDKGLLVVKKEGDQYTFLPHIGLLVDGEEYRFQYEASGKYKDVSEGPSWMADRKIIRALNEIEAKLTALEKTVVREKTAEPEKPAADRGNIIQRLWNRL